MSELGLEDVSVVQQDLAFTKLDVEFLSSLTLKQSVVEDPKAFNIVAEESLVYAVHCYLQIYDKVRKVAIPAILIGNDLDGKDDRDTIKKCPEIQKLYDVLEKSFIMPLYRDTFNDTVLSLANQPTRRPPQS